MTQKNLTMRHIPFGFGLGMSKAILFLVLSIILLIQSGFARSELSGNEDDVTGDVNPIVNPNELTIFPIEDIATLRSTQTIASTALFDYVAVTSDLDAWTQDGQQLSGSDPCNQSLGRRLHGGRVTTPAFEQAICQTPLGLSLYYGEYPTAEGEYITYYYPSPGIGTEYRNFDAAIGLFDRTASREDSVLHMDIATVHRNLYGVLTVSIIGYEPSETEGEIGQLVLRDSWTDPDERQVTGDATLSVGDYNNDGALDILVWADTSTGTDDAQTGRIDMASFSYDALNHELNHVTP